MRNFKFFFRSSNTSQLTNYEQLQVLFKILELTQTIDVLNESTVHQIHDSFTIVQELDVYHVNNEPLIVDEILEPHSNFFFEIQSL